jgi:hypothetical protein
MKRTRREYISLSIPTFNILHVVVKDLENLPKIFEKKKKRGVSLSQTIKMQRKFKD